MPVAGRIFVGQRWILAGRFHAGDAPTIRLGRAPLAWNWSIVLVRRAAAIIIHVIAGLIARRCDPRRTAVLLGPTYAGPHAHSRTGTHAAIGSLGYVIFVYAAVAIVIIAVTDLDPAVAFLTFTSIGGSVIGIAESSVTPVHNAIAPIAPRRRIGQVADVSTPAAIVHITVQVKAVIDGPVTIVIGPVTDLDGRRAGNAIILLIAPYAGCYALGGTGTDTTIGHLWDVVFVRSTAAIIVHIIASRVAHRRCSR